MQLNWLYLIGSPEYKKLLSGIIQLQQVAVRGRRSLLSHFVFVPQQFLSTWEYHNWEIQAGIGGMIGGSWEIRPDRHQTYQASLSSQFQLSGQILVNNGHKL